MTEAKSPYVKYYHEYLDPNAIRRIALKDNAVVEILRVESPSSLFVRPKDHMADDLIYREPYKMTPITEIHEGVYALAPLEERVFGRCIIVKNIELLELCRVFFIDQAVTANVSWKCLFQINEQEMYHPWQAMHITLGRVNSLTGNWTFEQKQEFHEILLAFEQFQITPSEVDLNDDPNRPSLLANLYGIRKNQTVKNKMAIEEICAGAMSDVLITIYPSNITADPKLADLDSEQDNLEIILLEEFRRGLPSDWREEAPEGYKESDEEWDINTCKIMEWNESWLEDYMMEDGCFWAFVSPISIVSPWDMHITPMLVDKGRMKDETWIMDQFKENKEKQRQFDYFYSLVVNQRPLEIEEIRFALTTGRAYAVASVQHRKKTGAQWLRVEILDFLPNNNIAVRFVDQGFRGFMKVKNLHRLHRLHTRIPPFTMEMGQFFDDDSVSEQEMEWCTYHWRQIVPYDVPVVIGPRLEFVETGKLLFSEMKNIEEEGNLLDEIPPAPVFTERSDDLTSWTEFLDEDFDLEEAPRVEREEEEEDYSDYEDEEEDENDSILSGGSQVY